MGGLFGQSEEVNTCLAFAVWIVFILSLFCLYSDIRIPYAEMIFIFLLIAGSIFYGFISKNPVKSFILGTLIWFSMFLFMLLYEIIETNSFPFLDNPLGIVSGIFTYLALGILNGGIGYFIAVQNSDQRKQLLCRILALALLFASAMFFFAGIN
ncbi:hypothetical protein MmiHf6_14910 [Methanimicrococcus hongohii]|uniref:Uncharacterized protein n=2 Tax=Methanimicrococcus hongohii TaxID=3028295 RepID=A0AA96V0K4_9EURY|nr:hypothetical protein MmiHf6_14910 [Methanimicrococcus sp. Hf6]